MKIATYLSSALFLFSCGIAYGEAVEKEKKTQIKTKKSGQYTDRIIVKMKDSIARSFLSSSILSPSNSGQATLSYSMIKAMADNSGESLNYIRPMRGASGHVVQLDRMASIEEARAIADAIAKNNDGVEYAEVDARVFPLATTPNDEFYTLRQWNLQSASEQGLNLPNAWDYTTGSSSVVVAVLDTGILRGHSDFSIERLLDGVDMVSADLDGQFLRSNDLNGRDTNPMDPGDWLDMNDLAETEFSDPSCQEMDSTWHGTHVSGIIGAASNGNGSGVAGVDWNAKILPVRVLGKCGGYASDVADGIYWAAGLSTTGVADNPDPANVINLSIGRIDECSVTEQNAIDAAREQGVVIVVAAGNDGDAVSAPGNCSGVITVAAHDKSGEKTSYSNFGDGVDIMAPGGDDFVNCVDGHGSILSLGDSGTTNAINDDALICMNGTSMAAPHISGLAALMLAKNPNLTPDQIESGIKDSARAFVTGSSCNTLTCGAGIADAEAAILETALPVAPSGFEATEVDLDLKFDWIDNSLLEKGFKIELDIDGQGFEDLISVEKDITTYTDENVIDDATLTYRLSSINGAYSSDYADEVIIVKPLVKARNLESTEVTSSQVKLTWLDGSNVELGYQIDRSDTGRDEENFKRLYVTAADVISYTDSNLIDGSYYYYRVKTITADGVNEAIEDIEVFTAINEPTFLTGRASSSQISLSWVDNAATETGFKLERSTDGVNYTQIASVASDVTAYIDGNVSGSSFYYYRVKAYKDSNDSESVYSEITSLSTPSSTKGAGSVHWYLFFVLLCLVKRSYFVKLN